MFEAADAEKAALRAYRDAFFDLRNDLNLVDLIELPEITMQRFASNLSDMQARVSALKKAHEGKLTVEFGGGHLYAIRIKRDLEEFLSYDDMISDLPEGVREKVLKIIEREEIEDPNRFKPVQNMTGQDFYYQLAAKVGGEDKASEVLDKAGIPGIRFLEGMARGKGKGAENIVMFNDRDTQVLTRSGDVIESSKYSTEEITQILEHIERAKTQRYSIPPDFILDPTKTQAFKNWFAESKAVDSRGVPKVLWHGSPDARGILGEAGAFERRYGVSDADEAYFFTDSKSVAKTYADDRRAFDYQAARPAVIPVYASLQNPLIIDAGGKTWGQMGGPSGQAGVIKAAKDGGHDGVIIQNTLDTYDVTGTERSDVYIAFKPEQMKSAAKEELRDLYDGSIFEGSGPNKGAFDPTDPRLRYSIDTKSANFKNWFGESKIVDENGSPLMVWHGTEEGGFSVFSRDFDSTSSGTGAQGFYFTDHKLGAETYSGSKTELIGGLPEDDFTRGNYPVYLKMENPLVIDFKGRAWNQ